MTNYYQILQVDQNATIDDIKKSYRKLALQYHPDKHPNNKEFEEKFKLISQAYDTLGNEEKRKKYNQELMFNSQQYDQTANYAHQFDDLLDMMHKMHHTNFNHVFRQRNPDITAQISITLEDAFTGKSFPVSINNNSANEINLTVSIPPGIQQGMKIKYAEVGIKQFPSLPAGDVYLIINILEHHKFKKHNSDLEMQVEVNCLDAILGTSIKISSIDGKEFDIKIPSGTQHGTKLRIKNQGMLSGINTSSRGDLLINVCIKVPTNLTEEAIKLIKIAQNQCILDSR